MQGRLFPLSTPVRVPLLASYLPCLAPGAGGFEAGFEAAALGSEGGGQTREHAQLARSLGVEQVRWC